MIEIKGVEIDITGPQGSGKSTVYDIVRKALMDSGLDVSPRDPDSCRHEVVVWGFVKPDDIPLDIWEKAYSTARDWFHEEWDGTEYIEWSLIESIARAVTSEREEK